MNLVVDVGNTLVKYAVYKQKKLVIAQSSKKEDYLSFIKEIFEVYPTIERAIVSSVGSLDKKLYQVLSLFCEVHRLDQYSKLPFQNHYASPATLGVDRLALVAAAVAHYPKENCLVVDLGSCITYDFVSSDGVYHGGAISPGVRMRFKAMHGQTARLPLLDPKFPENFIGDSTEDCMKNGVMLGVLYELEGLIGQYKNSFKHLTVILTGGDSHFFAKRLKNSIFANSKFLLEGLNYLLDYNKI